MDQDLIKRKGGIRLDLGCGENCQKGWVGMDIRPLPNVEIVHDVQDFPYPIDDNTCLTILMSHLWEHIEPKYRFRVMEELWRIMIPGGQLLISVPYYLSLGAYQDPSHYPCPNEATWTYFDPAWALYQVYKPKPWKIIQNNYVANANMEVILEAMKDGK
jgi:SAM-dependent methyltransferase